MIPFTALVQPVSALALAERRFADRFSCNLEAVSRPLDGVDALWWGATVRDLSSTGIGLTLCYPFRTGTYLAIDLKRPESKQTLLTRVVHIHDMNDGTWRIGCELVKPLDDKEVEALV
jgi:hypothetical protein